MKPSELRQIIKEDISKALKENQGTYLMSSDPTIKTKVEQVIQILNDIDVDGETMQYIIEQVGMNDQMLRQLIMTTGSDYDIECYMHEREELSHLIKQQ